MILRWPIRPFRLFFHNTCYTSKASSHSLFSLIPPPFFFRRWCRNCAGLSIFYSCHKNGKEELFWRISCEETNKCKRRGGKAKWCHSMSCKHQNTRETTHYILRRGHTGTCNSSVHPLTFLFIDLITALQLQWNTLLFFPLFRSPESLRWPIAMGWRPSSSVVR